MKKIYESPEIKAIDVKKEDIITNSYMTPEISVHESSDINSGDQSE